MTISRVLASAGSKNLTPGDRQQLNEWNAIPPSLLECCVHDLINGVYLAAPHAPAVCAWDGELTYEELFTLSGQLALLLNKQYGIGPEVFVPICSEKSCWTAVAILGVIRAGGAFVLLDPTHPPNRLKEMCVDVSASLVLASPSHASLAAFLTSKVIVVADILTATTKEVMNGAKISCFSKVNKPVHPYHALYAVFTSGSTGKPKGAVVSHQAFSTAAKMLCKPMGIGSKSRVFQFASYAFDVAVVEHLLTWVAGACVCIPSETERQNDLVGAVSRLGASWITLTPSVARILPEKELSSVLDTLVLAGEAVTQTDLDQWSARTTLRGWYGPAECAIAATVHPNLGCASKPTDIGRPYSVVCWVVDANDPNRLVPIGEEGELILEGHALGRGYINSPEQEAAAWIGRPRWLRRRGTSLYKTGDIVKYHIDGSLQYIGRKDTQVKLRGQRIELGEIEYHVRRCLPRAVEVVAEIVQISGRAHQLAVFICDDSDEVRLDSKTDLVSSPSESLRTQARQLRSKLKGQLPSYMLPEVLLRISHVPLTKTGKTDRKRLRNEASQLAPADHKAIRPFIEPVRTSREKALQRLWGEVLGIHAEYIGPNDNWFHLGGDSLLAMRLVGLATSSAGLDLTVRDILTTDTLAALAKVAELTTINEQSLAQAAPFELLPAQSQEVIIKTAVDDYQIPRELIEDIYPCTSLQYNLAQASSGHINLTGRFQATLPASVDLDRLVVAWKRVMETHPILRTRIIKIGGHFLQVVMKAGNDLVKIIPGTASLPMSDIWGLGKDLAFLSIQPMSHSLWLSIHHVLYDMYSLGEILRQMESAYHGVELRTRLYNSFISWVTRVSHETKSFWKANFNGFHGRLFPHYTPDHKIQATSRLPTHTIVLGGWKDGITVESQLRLALATGISRLLKLQDVVFGIMSSRRAAPVPGIAEIIGPTTSMVPFRIQLNEKNTLREVLRYIQDDMLKAAAHESAELWCIRGLSLEAARATQIPTILLLQPDPAHMLRTIFSPCKLDEGAVYNNVPLLFECVARRDSSVEISTIYDPRVVTDEQAQTLVKWIEYATGLMSKQPDMCVGKLLK